MARRRDLRDKRLVVLTLAFAWLGCDGFTPAPADGVPARTVASAKRNLAMGQMGIVAFRNSPFPYEGDIPEQNKPFLQQGPDGRLFHDAPRGGRLYADTTYSDRRSLLFIPPSFDPARPGAAIVLFFHGNLATLRDVGGRQGVPRQLLASGMNAALVAPQLAVDALDSSPGHFYRPGFFDRYLDEAAAHLATLSGDRFGADVIARLPVVIVAYSGGYLATAFSLHYATTPGRIRGVVYLDALFGEPGKLQSWLERTRGTTFFIDGYSAASSALSMRLLESLRADGIGVLTVLPPTIAPGDVVFLASPQAVHNDFVTRAWTRDPLASVLARIRLDQPARDATREPR